MNILFLAQRVPYPPNKGDKLRSFNEIRYLSQRHKIFLVCLADHPDELAHARALEDYCAEVSIILRNPWRSRLRSLLALFGNRPLTLAYFRVPALGTHVDRLLAREQFDVIYVYCSSMAQYVDRVTTIPKVIDLVDLDSEKWRQYADTTRLPRSLVYAQECTRLRAYEQQIASRFDHLVLVSRQEVDDFRALVDPDARLSAIPNGVDCDAFCPAQSPGRPGAMVFTGAMDYYANVDAVTYFVIEILPFIRQSVPDCTLTIVGSNPSPAVRQLAADHDGVIVTGAVPSVVHFVTSASVSVVPMRIARGVQNKVLESMAMGMPVVVTPRGLEGIDALPDRDLLVGETSEHFAAQVVRLLADASLREVMGGNARRFALEQCSWPTHLERLDQILTHVGKP